MQVKQYSYYFITFVTLISLILASTNYIIDPYSLFQTKRISGFNDKKPAAESRTGLFKPYNVINVNPETIIIGNSRPEMGLNPLSECWPKGMGTIYNLTFPGLGTYEQVRALFHAVSTENVNNILLGVDFIDFLQLREGASGIYWPKRQNDFLDRLLVDEQQIKNNVYSMAKLKDYTRSLFSLDALNDSVYTLISQTKNSTNRTNLGFNPANDFKEMVYYEGSWVLFKQKQNLLKRIFSKRNQSIYDSSRWSIQFEAIKRAIQLSETKKIKLILFINPYHYSYLELIRNSGYWNEFESFKKKLVEIVHRYGKNQVEIWDFSIYSKYSVTTIPKENTKPQYSWFWEPAHYKAELGEYMIADIFDTHCIAGKNKKMGANLNKTDITKHLNLQRQQRQVLLNKLNNQF